MTYEKTKKLLNKEDYPFGTPTQIKGRLKKTERIKSDHPWGIRKGYHLVRINSNTEIEIKDGRDDTQARESFVAKMERSTMAFYNNLQVQMAKHVDL